MVQHSCALALSRVMLDSVALEADSVVDLLCIAVTPLDATARRARVVSCKRALLDTHDLPRVISYKELDQTSVEDITKKLMDEGLHVSPQESKNGSTIKTILEKGLAEMENMLVIKTPANPLVTQFPTDPTSVDNPKNKNSESSKDSVDKTSHANRIVYSARGVVGTVVLSLIL
ncbi:hypothetical protein BG011_009498 [Mortierella polycephala]|uniref:Uncharacterized protein n=1 Tax=Mortierella polycephala TaxID=41804 RepID=A0A9P6PP32_9FUNG|nr:hypothetical protein BG011_009498 [Mortierella polycephala]